MESRIRNCCLTLLLLAAAMVITILGCSSRIKGLSRSDSMLGGWEMFRGNSSGSAVETLFVAGIDTVLWKSKIGGKVYASPAIAGSFGVLPALDKKVYFFDPETGEVLGRIKSEAPSVSAPAIAGSLVYVAAEKGDGRLRCINVTSGKTIWELMLRDISAPIITNERDIFVGNNAGVFYSINRFTGEINWKDSMGGSIAGGAAVSNERVFVGSARGFVKCYELDGEEIWEADAGAAVLSSPAVSEYCYVTLFNGRLVALDKTSGQEVWSFATSGAALGSPIVDHGAVYFGSNDRCFYSVSATNGSLVWKKDLGGICGTTPLVASDEIVICCRDGRVVFLDKQSGSERLVFRTEGRIFSSPVPFGNRIYVAGADKLLYCFGSSSAETQPDSAKSAALLSE